MQLSTLHRRDAPALRAQGVRVLQGDLADRETVHAAAQGCELVFHVAAKVGVVGHYEEYYRANVIGTQNVLSACGRHRVRALIYTSSPSVVFAGRDQENHSESSATYPERFYNAYQKTKAMAEKQVLQANGEGSLATLALRPHLIWGEGDPHLVARIVERGRRGAVRLVSGSRKKVDATHVDNAVQAHLAAADSLHHPEAACAGRAYFIADGAALPLCDLLNHILQAAGLPAARRSIPAPLAWCMGAVAEAAHRCGVYPGEPPLTRFVARQLATAHWYDLSAAQRDLGYKPVTTMEEGMARLRVVLRQDADRRVNGTKE